MNWLSQYGLNHFTNYAGLRLAFLSRFRKEKTAGDLLKKIKGLKQKKMLVEDYAQKFRSLLARLEVDDTPSAESQAAYFINGLRRNLRNSVANVDITAGFEQIVLVATRVEKRLGVLPDKKKKSRSFDSESDSNSDSESESDDDTESEEESDSDSDDKKRKKKKSSRIPSSRSKGGKKKPKKMEEDDHQFLKRLKDRKSVV